MTNLASQKRAVELTVDEDGYGAAERMIKQQHADSRGERLELLGYARKYASQRQEVEA